LEGKNVRLIWTAIPSATYRLEYKGALSETNWTELAGEVTALTNTASTLDLLTTSNRFYRVRLNQ
jgi:hypothetical protein